MRRLAVVFAIAFFAATAALAQSADSQFQKLLDDEWEWTVREFPTQATRVGDNRYNDRMPDFSGEAIERRRAHARELVGRVRAIDRTKLSPANRLNYDLYLLDAEQDVEGQRFRSDFIQLTQRGGVHSQLANLAQSVPKANARDYENFIKRLGEAPRLVDQSIAQMRKGLAAGITPPRITLRDAAELIGNQIHDDPTKTPIYQQMFSSGSADERVRVQAAEVIRTKVTPAFRRLQRFFTEEYYPKTREAVGLSAVPDGRDWYAYLVRNFTTTNMTPDEIHNLGLSEVKRIRGEMEKVRESTGFKGSLAEFFTFLRTDPRFYFTEKEALLKEYRDIAKRADPELTKLFGTLPRLPYGIVPVPAYAEKTATTAYYSSGSLEAGRPGLYYANTYNLPARPKWEMEALTLHEAVPGHHLQLAIQQELGELPKFRRFGGYTAFIEGWGLYAESLGPEMGFYKDPYSKFGQLTYEMWRAIRLVVDTGMHSKGWSRQRAIDFFRENAGKTEHDIVVEIDRYINSPGQALAYKIGELKFKELRALATRELGDRFDIRRFHDAVLGAGALPLSVLETQIREWI
ncbi:MAG TPA: DUF885 domain-containing protein, partial [Thermoanaerobaculia bacterium]|nr:DUF885 domain-containing protein [Thermoanaerobaculia bacterium]